MGKKDKKVKPIYEKLTNTINYSDLPIKWRNYDLTTFSEKRLYHYQEEALRFALKFLFLFNKICKKENDLKSAKTSLYNKILNFETGKVAKKFNLSSKNLLDLFPKLREYYNIKKKNGHEEVEFFNFVNRMGFWMATGSGKTLVLIKLIEIMNKLQEKKLIPQKDFLILTYRKDLIEQMKEHIEEFNQFAENKLRVWSLKDYPDVKNGNRIVFMDDINIYIYRSDLISEETKEKILNFEDIDNGGNWYLFLDEAHKGKTDESKRQAYYSILTRNGFLFNFSATFTHEWDILTTVYNFNLEKFTKKGYGKNVFLFDENLKTFLKKNRNFDEEKKRKIVLKGLILLTFIKQIKAEISFKYHEPLLVCLVNSVNTTDSDLELFFREVEQIAQKKRKNLFKKAKKELIEQVKTQLAFEFSNETINFDISWIKKIEKENVLNEIFNSKSHGELEVIHYPQNKKELIFKLKTSKFPFALIKIGNKTTWVKEKLKGYDFTEDYDYESYFKHLNDPESPINLLLGSRSFYEGWDSNRPNIMFFINIGRGDSRKFILQSIGRGVRIEPIEGKRKRLKYLNDTKRELDVDPLETLFIFGTSIKNLEKLLNTMKYIREYKRKGIELIRNPFVEKNDFPLYIPKYDKCPVNDVEELPKIKLNRQLLLNFLDWIGEEKLLLTDFPEITPKLIKKVKEYLNKGKFEEVDYQEPKFQLRKLISHLKTKAERYKKFKKLKDEIIHFKNIETSLSNQELKILNKKILKVINSVGGNEKIADYKLMQKKGEITLDEFTEKVQQLANKSSTEEEFKSLEIKKLSNHYYVPLIMSKNAKLDYINHIIDVESERAFLKDLEKYLKKENNLFKNFDWWLFSKIDEHLDNIYIPYSLNSKFIPDFIFWLKKKDNYYIIFVDPKGTSYAQYQDKIDGYENIFNVNGKVSEFQKENYTIQVYLKLYADDIGKVHGLKYSDYWGDNIKDLISDL